MKKKSSPNKVLEKDTQHLDVTPLVREATGRATKYLIVFPKSEEWDEKINFYSYTRDDIYRASCG